MGKGGMGISLNALATACKLMKSVSINKNIGKSNNVPKRPERKDQPLEKSSELAPIKPKNPQKISQLNKSGLVNAQKIPGKMPPVGITPTKLKNSGKLVIKKQANPKITTTQPKQPKEITVPKHPPPNPNALKQPTPFPKSSNPVPKYNPPPPKESALTKSSNKPLPKKLQPNKKALPEQGNLTKPKRAPPKRKLETSKTISEKLSSVVIRINLPNDCEAPFKMLLIEPKDTGKDLLSNLNKKLEETNIKLDSPELHISVHNLDEKVMDEQLISDYFGKYKIEDINFYILTKNLQRKTLLKNRETSKVADQAPKKVVEVHFHENSTSMTSKLVLEATDKSIDFITKICKKKRAQIQGVITLKYDDGVYVFTNNDYIYNTYEKYEKKHPKLIYSDAQALVAKIYLPYSSSTTYTTIKLEYETTAKEVMELSNKKLRQKNFGGLLSFIGDREITFKEEDKPYTLYNAYGKENCKIVFAPSFEIQVTIAHLSNKITNVILQLNDTTSLIIQKIYQSLNEPPNPEAFLRFMVESPNKRKSFVLNSNDQIYQIYNEYYSDKLNISLLTNQQEEQITEESQDEYTQEEPQPEEEDDIEIERPQIERISQSEEPQPEEEDDIEIEKPQIERINQPEEEEDVEIEKPQIERINQPEEEEEDVEIEKPQMGRINFLNNDDEDDIDSDPMDNKIVEVNEDEGVDVDIILQEELLFKKNLEDEWEMKWFVYTGEDLLIFESNESEEPEGFLEIKSSTEIQDVEDYFTICTDSLTWFITSEYYEVYNTWVSTLNDNIELKK